MSHATSRAFPLIVLLLGPVACDEGDGSDTTAGQACEGAKCDDVEGEPTGGGDGAGGTDQAQVRFSALRVDGPRVAGGTLSIEYDLERLTTCRATHNGSPFWDITAHALFTPGNQQVEGSVREITLEGSPPAQVVRPLAFDVEIPEDATAVQVWFRNFDGNGTCEDFDNASGANHQFDIEPAGAGPDAATLTLPLEVAVEGDLVPGGSLQIEYDLERLTTCRATHNGSPFWDITAHALFTPGNQQVEGSVREITLEGSPPAQVVRPLAFEVEIPEDATAVQVWFRNFDGNGTCEDFDSANGQNHRFQVE